MSKSMKKRIADLERSRGLGKKIIIIQPEDVGALGESSAAVQERHDKKVAELVAQAKAEGYREEDIIIVQMWQPDGLDG